MFQFRTIYNLTYGTMGRHSSIDTSLFRSVDDNNHDDDYDDDDGDGDGDGDHYEVSWWR